MILTNKMEKASFTDIPINHALSAPVKKTRVRNPEALRQALIDSAAVHFNTVGYFATNSNTIAKDAGYASGSFYNHFSDKLAVFLAVYQQWVDAEWSKLTTIIHDNQDASLLAEQLVFALEAHHQHWRVFRLSLLALVATEPKVAEYQNGQRQRQIVFMQQLAADRSVQPLSPAHCLMVLLASERLLDLLANHQLTALGISDEEVRAELVQLLKGLFVGRL